MNVLKILQDYDNLVASQSAETIKVFLVYCSNKKNIRNDKQILIKFNQQQIMKLIRIFTTIFYNFSQRQHFIIEAFHQILTIYSKIKRTEILNDFSLALINMQGYYYLQYRQQLFRNGQLNDASDCFQRSLKYIDQQIKTNPMLLAISLNNLSVLYMNKNRYKEAIIYSFEAIDRLEMHIIKVKKQGSYKIRQQIVPLINTYLTIGQCLDRYLKSYDIDESLKKQYIKYIQTFNSRGYRLSLKYLGKDSVFSKMYSTKIKNIKNYREIKNIPIIYKPNKINTDLFNHLFDAIEKKINPRIQEIINLLMHRQEVIQQVQKQVEISKINERKQIIYQVNKLFNDHEQTVLNFKMFKGQKSKFGKILLQASKRAVKIGEQLIPEQQVANLTTILNVNDTRPYAIKTNNCTLEQFAKYCVLPFVHFENNKIELKSVPTGILPEKQIQFMKQTCKVVVNYIKSNLFRISLFCDRMNSTACIQVEIQDALMVEVLQRDLIQNTTDQKIIKLLAFLNKQKQNQSEQQSFQAIKIKNSQIFQSQIMNVCKKVENFLEAKKVFGESIFNQKLYLIKFQVYQWIKKGRICILNNNQIQKKFNILLENTYETVAPNGNIYAKGYGTYNYDSFLYDFGISYGILRRINEKLQIYYILLKKYSLISFDFEMTQAYKNTYSDNAIIEFPIIPRVFKRKYHQKNYQIPSTVSLLTVKDQFPIGIKIVAFDIQTCIQKGIFLTLRASNWAKKRNLESITNPFIKKLGKYKYQDQFPVINNFYLHDILKKVGFQMLLSQFRFQKNSKNYVMGEETQFGRLDDFINLKNVQVFVQK